MSPNARRTPLPSKSWNRESDIFGVQGENRLDGNQVIAQDVLIHNLKRRFLAINSTEGCNKL